MNKLIALGAAVLAPLPAMAANAGWWQSISIAARWWLVGPRAPGLRGPGA